jgi:hypothetical protein
MSAARSVKPNAGVYVPQIKGIPDSNKKLFEVKQLGMTCLPR